MHQSQEPAKIRLFWIAVVRITLAIIVTAVSAISMTQILQRVHEGNIFIALLLSTFPAVALGALVAFGTLPHYRDFVGDDRPSSASESQIQRKLGRVVTYYADDVKISIVPAKLHNYDIAMNANFNGAEPHACFPSEEAEDAKEYSPLIGAGIDLFGLQGVLDRHMPRFDCVVDFSTQYGDYELPFFKFPCWGFHSGEAIFVRPQSDFLVETIELQLCQLAPERLELWQELLGSLQQFVDLLLVDTDRGLIVPLGDRDALRSYLQEVPTERIIDLQD